MPGVDWFWVEDDIETPVSWDHNAADLLTGAGLVESLDENEDPIIQEIIWTEASDVPDPLVPLAPILVGIMPTRTTVELDWVAADNTGRPPILEWDIEQRSSTDDGANFGAWAPVAGSPFAAADFDVDLSGLATGTPEIVFQWRARAVNADGDGDWSAQVERQWDADPVQRPDAPTNFRSVDATISTRTVAWDFVADPDVDKFGIIVAQRTLLDPTSVLIDNIDPGLLAYVIQGLSGGQTYSNYNIRAHTSAGWGPASNNIEFTQPTSTPPLSLMMTGSSSSTNDHGGTEDWQGWRVYTRSEMLDRANRTGSQRPLFLAYSVDGTPLGSSGNNGVATLTYTAIFNYVKAELDNFYYSGGATSQTHSSRWGIRLYWSNGNENSDKGILSNPTQANIDNFVEISQRALYDAVHFTDPVMNQRRYPDAYAGSNPTQEHERLGEVEAWLHPSAKYHDFVMWSMYPPGRGVNDPDLSRNPRWDFPSFNEADRTNRQQGYLIRCFYRTKQAEAQARIDLNDSEFSLIIGCGEYGMASDPDDRATRPYFYCIAGIGSMYVLAGQYSLAMDFACAWDNVTVNQGETKVTSDSPHNILSDEPPNSDHLAFGGGGSAGNNSVATNPSTRVAWVDFRDYDPRRGGTHPAQWAGKPGNIDDYTGTLI